MISKKAVETKKKSNKACLVVTITIVVLLNLGVYFFYDEISKEVSSQYDKYFGDDDHSMTLDEDDNEYNTTDTLDMIPDPTEAATTKKTTTKTTTESEIESWDNDNDYNNAYDLDSDEEETKSEAPETTEGLTEAPTLTTITEGPTEAPKTTITPDDLESSGSGGGSDDEDDFYEFKNKFN